MDACIELNVHLILVSRARCTMRADDVKDDFILKQGCPHSKYMKLPWHHNFDFDLASSSLPARLGCAALTGLVTA